MFVAELPEGWKIPSIMTLTTQIGQIGPIIFVGLRWISPKKVTYTRGIYTIFMIGLISCIALAFTWNKTHVIFKEKRSVYLYIFNFTLSLLGTFNIIKYLFFS